jgi:uncharacterized repeat protein (TIGR03803 family)
VTPQSTQYRTFRAALAAIALILTLNSMGWAASEKVLYRFHGKDGDGPANVIVGAGGALYGTTVAGGTATKSCLYKGCGVVFRLALGTDGKWHETILHRFTGTDGWFPTGSLIADKAGSLYGTTVYGGPNGCSGLGCGVAFELEKGNGGKWTYKVLHYFFQQQGDGLQPYAGMVFDSQGDLYGTTSGGGNFSVCLGGCGVVFKLAPDGKGNWTESVLYAFGSQLDDGAVPLAPLIFDSVGNLYGTTEWGGNNGAGAVFELSLGKNGQWADEVLHSFSVVTKDGDQPGYGVTFDGSGNLYGTTAFGGTPGQEGWGTAFRLVPVGNGKWKETVLRSFDENKIEGGNASSGLVLDAAGNLYGAAESGGEVRLPWFRRSRLWSRFQAGTAAIREMERNRSAFFR